MNADPEGFAHGLVIDAPAARVFGQLTTRRDIAAWREYAVSGSPGRPGGRIAFGYVEPQERATLAVERLEPGVLVLWRVVEDSRHGGEWLDTRIRFRLSAIDSRTTLLEFRHAGLTPLLRCYGECVREWQHLLGNLKRIAEAAAHRPAPRRP